jgi:hypothetical protein
VGLPRRRFGLVSPERCAEHPGCMATSPECSPAASGASHCIAGNEHPDHDTIASFRRRFLKQIEALFVESLPPRKPAPDMIRGPGC